MTFDFRPLRITFDQTQGIIQEESATATFSTKVRKATAALNGFNVKYKSGDHPTSQQIVDISKVEVNDNTVKVTVKLLLKDSTGPIDDAFGGQVDVAVLADVA